MDPYTVLGINQGANIDEVKKAYRKRALETHPDRNPDNPNAEEEFKKVNEAYNRIINPQPQQAFRGQDPFSIFEEFMKAQGGGFNFNFGFNNRSRKQQPGEHIRLILNVSFSDLILGGKFTVEYERRGQCKNCKGLGGESTETCNECNGSGWQVLTQVSHNVINQTRRPCPNCNGQGSKITNACSDCHATGIQLERMKEDIIIPPHNNPHTNPLQRNAMEFGHKGHYGQRGGNVGSLVVSIIPVFPTVDQLTTEQQEILKQLKFGK